MTKKNKLKGFTGPRSKSFKSEDGPIELPDLEPIEIDDEPNQPAPAADPGELVDYRTTHNGVVDQTLPRRHKCGRCIGQGYIPSARHCGAGQPCPDCEGTGKITPAKITRPATPIGPGSTQAATKHAELLSHDPHFKPRKHPDQAQELLPGDIDYQPPASQAEPKELPASLSRYNRKKKTTTKRKKKSDTPPWERPPIRSTATKIADAKAAAEHERAPWD